MAALTDDQKRAVARLQFAPLPPDWKATYERYLVKGTGFGGGGMSDFSANDYDPLVPENKDVDINLQDLKSIVGTFRVDGWGRRRSEMLHGEFGNLTERVVDSYMHCICTYKNEAVRSKAAEGSTGGGGNQQGDIEKGDPEKITQPGVNSPRTPPNTVKKSPRDRNRSRSPPRDPIGPNRKGSSTYRSRTPVSDGRKSLRKEPWEQTATPGPTPGRKSTQHTGHTQAIEPDVQQLSCLTLYCEDWARVCHGTGILSEPEPGGLSRKLEDLDCLGATLRNLDYLFLPTNDERVHFFLVGIAPKQKFVFAIDSFANNAEGHKLDDVNVDPIVEILLQEFLADADDWPMYGQWANRSKTTDNSPDAAQQSDIHNCGVFTITNALCLAFGYDLLCFTQKDLDEGKRPRMAAELLNGGFTNPFNYPLLDIPFRQYRTIIDPHGERFPGQSPIDPDTEMGDGHIVEVGHRRAITTKTGEGEWPAQFDPRFFQKAGLIYKIKEPMFKDLKYKYQLEKACREHKIERYSVWKKKPLELFRRWMENVMAGRKAESSGGLRPFSSFVGKKRGKKTGLKKQAETKLISIKLANTKMGQKSKMKEVRRREAPSRTSARVRNRRKV